MKNKKGFTLIELLAVIVILAIIALIATPIVLGIIEEARNNAKNRSAELVIQSVELAYSTAFMKNNGEAPSITDVEEAFKMENAEWNVDKETKKITITSGKTTDAVTCDVSQENNRLSVTCTGGKGKTYNTSASMELAQ